MKLQVLRQSSDSSKQEFTFIALKIEKNIRTVLYWSGSGPKGREASALQSWGPCTASHRKSYMWSEICGHPLVSWSEFSVCSRCSLHYKTGKSIYLLSWVYFKNWRFQTRSQGALCWGGRRKSVCMFELLQKVSESSDERFEKAKRGVTLKQQQEEISCEEGRQ